MRRILVFAAIFACNADTFTDDGGVDAEPDSIIVGGGDGSVDAPGKDVVVSPPKHFCDFQDAQFCADFDVPGDAGAGFSAPNLQGGWQLTFQNQQTMDASPMAVSVITAGDAAGAALIDNPNLAKSSSTGPSTLMIVEADVFLVSTGLVPDAITIFRAGVTPDPQLTFGLAMQSNVWKLVRRAGGSPMTLSPQPQLNQWLHAVLAINIAGGTVTLTVGGTSTAVLSGATAIDGGPSTYPGYVAIGGDDQFFPNNSSVRSFVDNVTVRWQ